MRTLNWFKMKNFIICYSSLRVFLIPVFDISEMLLTFYEHLKIMKDSTKEIQIWGFILILLLLYLKCSLSFIYFSFLFPAHHLFPYIGEIILCNYTTVIYHCWFSNFPHFSLHPPIIFLLLCFCVVLRKEKECLQCISKLIRDSL